jgi:hypothetical protein
MATIVRSLGHQLTPVKYSIDVPQSSTNAAILFFASSCCALSIRDSLSAFEIGFVSAESDEKLLLVSFGFDASGPEHELRPGITLAVTDRAPSLIKSFLFTFIKNQFSSFCRSIICFSFLKKLYELADGEPGNE